MPQPSYKDTKKKSPSRMCSFFICAVLAISVFIPLNTGILRRHSKKRSRGRVNIDEIKKEHVNAKTGIKLGNPNAPVKVIEFTNFRCPFCKKWFELAREVLQPYVDAGQVQRIIKHVDKETGGLRKGNVLHAYLPYNQPEQAFEEMAYFSETLSEWGDLTEAEIQEMVETKRGLRVQDNTEHAQAIVKEAKAANVTLVPSVFIGDSIMDESVSKEELITYIEAELDKQQNIRNKD